MRALIIEDQFLIAWHIRELLTELGFSDFDTAATEAEAVALGLARPPDLITVDLRLRAGSGLRAATRICAARPAACIYVTANRELLPRAEAIAVDKPFTAQSFRQAYARLCGAAAAA